jgi:hypothetical protein
VGHRRIAFVGGAFSHCRAASARFRLLRTY